MYKKMMPIIILILFLIGMYYMLKGMNHAVSLAKGEHGKIILDDPKLYKPVKEEDF